MKLEPLPEHKDNILEISTTRESVFDSGKHPVNQPATAKTKLSRI